MQLLAIIQATSLLTSHKSLFSIHKHVFKLQALTIKKRALVFKLFCNMMHSFSYFLGHFWELICMKDFFLFLTYMKPPEYRTTACARSWSEINNQMSELFHVFLHDNNALASVSLHHIARLQYTFFFLFSGPVFGSSFAWKTFLFQTYMKPTAVNSIYSIHLKDLNLQL